MPFPRKKIKRYPHFDAHLSLKEIENIVTNPGRVASNAFYPFILYEEKWIKFRTRKGVRSKSKEAKKRPIRYASRRDSYIYTHYRAIMSKKYEDYLHTKNVAHCVLAYRKIKDKAGRGKSNIDFANDVFCEIVDRKNCVAIALDISSFFENLSHHKIYEMWNRLLDTRRLPPDHFAVYKNITRYHVVPMIDVYKRLGYAEQIIICGKKINKFTTKRKDMPIQLCSPCDFKAKIAGGNPSFPSIIKGNVDKCGRDLLVGIPQGSPISDLIANFCMVDFDVALNEYCEKQGGSYRRYSDDILIILPGKEAEADEAEAVVRAEIKKTAAGLKINSSKTCVTNFFVAGEKRGFYHIRGAQGKNGLEYLGFRFDGHNIYIKDSTISRLYRKLSSAAKAAAINHVKSHMGASIKNLIDSFNYSHFIQKFGRVDKAIFDESDPSTWTFHTYAKRCEYAFKSRGKKVMGQIKGIKKIARMRIVRAIKIANCRALKSAAGSL